MQATFQKHITQSQTQSQSKAFVPPVPVPIIQKKLGIGAPNDPLEAEADSMADKVVGMNDSHIHTKQHSGPLVQRKCAACEEEMVQRKSLASEITPMVQRQSHSSESGTASQALTQQINSSKGNGHSLDKGTQSFMESRFGTDFSGVRIHTDTQAIQMSRDLNAQAFTVGNNIYFNEGKYNPNSNSGKHLLAHELTHTLQQSKNTAQLKIQRALACPTKKPKKTPKGWKKYFGNSCIFHCCFDGIIEDRSPTPSDPQNECFYDDYGNLVTSSHEYANCGGTPNDYDSSTDWWDHTFNDRGGIWHKGRVAYNESRRYAKDRDLVLRIGKTRTTPPQPHLGRRQRTIKTGLVWVTIGKKKVLIIAEEAGGSGRLRFLMFINQYFKPIALKIASKKQGTIPVVPTKAVVGMPSSIPSNAVTK
ncbi:DUF4157 domain-containing protein [Winogradskyella sp.]|uniref:eCIS core domain-containing protein n=1 Tax=Winogradskyella sp. TaxID=1883156 RepID=UPI003BAABCA1